jgi:hypothetical protein
MTCINDPDRFQSIGLSRFTRPSGWQSINSFGGMCRMKVPEYYVGASNIVTLLRTWYLWVSYKEEEIFPMNLIDRLLRDILY